MFDTILITGSAGLIGSHLVNKFLSMGYKVIGIDNLIGGYESNMPSGNSNFYYFKVDILDNKALKEVFDNYNPDIVIHCAALAHEGLSVFSPKTIVENIYAGTISVASAAIAAGAKLFINTSSMARYGNAAAPFKEDTVPNPIDPYGMAKLHAEQQLNLLSEIHGLKVFHVIPHNVCGPHQCYSDPFRNVMSIFANRILHEKPIYIYGDGDQQRSFSHVDDCVRAYVTLVNKHNDIENTSVFNIGPDDGSEISIKELASVVSKYFNTQPDIIHLPGRPREVQNAWVSTEKARQLLEYVTNNSTEDTVRDTVLWIKNSARRDFNYHLNLEIINESTPKTWTDKLFNK
jgi:UDP-glucose 4-epimerase